MKRKIRHSMTESLYIIVSLYINLHLDFRLWLDSKTNKLYETLKKITEKRFLNNCQLCLL